MSMYDEAADIFSEAHGPDGFGVSVTLDGAPVSGVFNDEKRDAVFADFATRASVERLFVVLRSAVATAPAAAPRSELVYGATIYAVTAVAKDDVHFYLGLQIRT